MAELACEARQSVQVEGSSEVGPVLAIAREAINSGMVGVGAIGSEKKANPVNVSGTVYSEERPDLVVFKLEVQVPRHILRFSLGKKTESAYLVFENNAFRLSTDPESFIGESIVVSRDLQSELVRYEQRCISMREVLVGITALAAVALGCRLGPSTPEAIATPVPMIKSIKVQPSLLVTKEYQEGVEIVVSNPHLVYLKGDAIRICVDGEDGFEYAIHVHDDTSSGALSRCPREITEENSLTFDVYMGQNDRFNGIDYKRYRVPMCEGMMMPCLLPPIEGDDTHRYVIIAVDNGRLLFTAVEGDEHLPTYEIVSE
ncbi:hypothetical protein ACFLY9_02365 [Patescibacteria group bacterium]